MEQVLETLQRDMAEEVGYGLAVVGPADGLGKDHGNVDNLQRSESNELDIYLLQALGSMLKKDHPKCILIS